MYTRDNPSKEYLDLIPLVREYHAKYKKFDGQRTFKCYHEIKWLCDRFDPKTIFDYGCGKGIHYKRNNIVIGKGPGKLIIPTLEEGLGVKFTGFDPCHPKFDKRPPAGTTFGGTICVDVMGAIPEQDLPWVFQEMFEYGEKFVFLNCSGTPAKKTYSDGRSATSCNRPMEWWIEKVTELAKPGTYWLLKARPGRMIPWRYFEPAPGGWREISKDLFAPPGTRTSI